MKTPEEEMMDILIMGNHITHLNTQVTHLSNQYTHTHPYTDEDFMDQWHKVTYPDTKLIRSRARAITQIS